MVDVEADRGGKGKEGDWGETSVFLPSPSPDPFFCDSDPGYGFEAA